MINLIFLTFLIICTSVNGQVISLNSMNFQETMENSEYLLVKFYAPWCGHCRAMAEDYKRLASDHLDSAIKIAEVDATVETSLASEYKITGYPVLKWFINGTEYEYRGGRKYEDMASWVKRAAMQWYTPLYTKSDVDIFIGKIPPGGARVIANDLEGDLRPLTVIIPVLEYGLVKPSEIMLRWPSKTIRVYYRGRETDLVNGEHYCWPDICEWEWENDEKDGKVSDFIKIKSIPPIVSLNNGLAMKRAFYYSKKHVLSFASNETREAVLNQLYPVAEAFSPEYIFVDVPDNYTDIYLMFGVEKEEVPTIKFVEVGKEVFKYNLKTAGVTSKNVRETLDSIKSGKHEPHWKSEDIPENNTGKVKKIVGKTYKNFTEPRQNDTFVMFYAPWCQHCKTFKPVWNQLADLLTPEGIVLADMDATANEAPGLRIKSFPTLLWYGTNGNQPVLFEGERDLEHLVEFVHNLHPVVDKPETPVSEKSEL